MSAVMLGLLLLLSTVLAPVEGQTTDVRCGSRWSWMNNDLNQNPCLVGAYLENQCIPSGGNWNVGALEPNLSYVGPRIGQGNYCLCSSVVYSLISACAACQNEKWIPWSRWVYNCTDLVISQGVWPLDLPLGTSVPAWAYLDLRDGDTFDVRLARSFAGEPESTYIGTPTASISFVPSTTDRGGVATTAIMTLPVDGTTNLNRNSSNTGVIVGGVIGGIATLTLIVGLIIFFWRRRDDGPLVSPIRPYADGELDMAESSVAYARTQHHVTTGSPGPTMRTESPTIFPPTPPPVWKVYNPSEPSTYNTPSASIGHAHSSQRSNPSAYMTAASVASGGYRGTAEV